ncbi:MAG: hypothetical protein REI78_05340 [Pedobacter sp.]|nr:hypothetical protein [Pedobacter sp.]MDQ8052424.1 hypothetical protein [Pedobacter sp.]
MKINYNDINTLGDLQAQIHRLKHDYEEKGLLLKTDAKNYVKQFTLGNLIKKYATPSGFLKLDEKTNISSKIMSVVLPLLLNKTIFRGSGLITKALAAMVSGKVGQQLDGEHLSGVFNMVKSLFKGKKSKKENAFVDYGIPPDSETY